MPFLMLEKYKIRKTEKASTVIRNRKFIILPTNSLFSEVDNHLIIPNTKIIKAPRQLRVCQQNIESTTNRELGYIR